MKVQIGWTGLKRSYSDFVITSVFSSVVQSSFGGISVAVSSAGHKVPIFIDIGGAFLNYPYFVVDQCSRQVYILRVTNIHLARDPTSQRAK